MTELDASYSYTLKADSGYQSSMSGRITPEQHAAITRVLGNKSLGVRGPLACGDCGGFNPCYMVTREVWEASRLPQKGALCCFKCLEARIGRPLALSDFTDAPINDPVRFGYALAARQPDAACVPAEATVDSAPWMPAETEPEYAWSDGWNACRDAMLAGGAE